MGCEKTIRNNDPHHWGLPMGNDHSIREYIKTGLMPPPFFFSSTLSLFPQKAAPKVYDFIIINSEFTFCADHFSL